MGLHCSVVFIVRELLFEIIEDLPYFRLLLFHKINIQVYMDYTWFFFTCINICPVSRKLFELETSWSNIIHANEMKQTCVIVISAFYPIPSKVLQKIPVTHLNSRFLTLDISVQFLHYLATLECQFSVQCFHELNIGKMVNASDLPMLHHTNKSGPI